MILDSLDPNLTPNDSERPPWESSSLSDMTLDASAGSDEETLEVYEKAKNFNTLKLVSGNTVEGNIEDYIAKQYGSEGRSRCNLAKFLMKKLNLIPARDVLLALACNKPARIIIATAGAGKTTSLHLDLCVSKLYDKATGKNVLAPVKVEGTEYYYSPILYLNYNKHNVQPILDRHHQMVASINRCLRAEERISDNIESSTVHAFCRKWLDARKCGEESSLTQTGLEIIPEEKKQRVWEAVITPRLTKFYGDSESAPEVSYTVLDSLYTYKVESMMSWESFFVSAKFVDSGLRDDFVKSCIKKYDSMKTAMGLIDFTDYLLQMIDYLKENPEFLEELQKRYRIIIADENQDFTALMNELLLLLYNPKYNRLIVVGDPDQTIYQFKGVSTDNVVSLYQRLSDVALLGLDTNYRCPDKIVDAAKRILDMNILRFKKPILTVKTGGEIIEMPSSYAGQQEKQVISIISRLSREEQERTVITYRNNSSAQCMAEELYYAGIPFRMLDGTRPFNSPAFRHIKEAMQALAEKDNPTLNAQLYRFLPLPRARWDEILEANRSYRRNHLHDLKFPHGMPNGCLEAINKLIEYSVWIDSHPTSAIIDGLVELYRKYHYDFIVKRARSSDSGRARQLMDDLDRTIKFFRRDYMFSYAMKELSERNTDCVGGVSLATFHALKGLEFDYVFAIDFCDVLFPNFADKEMRYQKNTAIEEKESENRLCYVLVTRTIKKLYLCYPENDPSIYVRILVPKNKDEQHNELLGKDDIVLGNTLGSSANTLSKLGFIKRLTERG